MKHLRFVAIGALGVVIACQATDQHHTTGENARAISQALTLGDPCLAEPLKCCPPGLSPVTLTPNADSANATAQGQCIIGLAGNDTITNWLGGVAAVVSGPGNDNVTVGAESATLFTGDGNDQISAYNYAGQHRVNSGAGDDQMYVGGTSLVIPGPGRDHVQLGAGDDTLIINAPCEIQAGEFFGGGPGNDTLITPLPLATLQAMGVGVQDFEQIVIEDHACESECTQLPSCPTGGSCKAGATPGSVTCSSPPVWQGPGAGPAPEPAPPEPPSVVLAATYTDFGDRLGDIFPFLRVKPGQTLDATAQRQYHAYSDQMAAQLHLEGEGASPKIARVMLFDRINASSAVLAQHTSVVTGFLEAIGSATANADVTTFIAPGASTPTLERRVFSSGAHELTVTVNRDYGMVTLEARVGNGEFSWRSDEGAEAMGPVADRACFFTRLGGQFEGGGEKIQIEQINSEWFINGSSHRPDQALDAKARCFKTSFVSAEFAWIDDDTGSVDLGVASDRACFLTHVQGDFEGGGEKVEIVQRNGHWFLEGHSAQDDASETLRGSARCVPATEVTAPFSWSQGDTAVNMGSGVGRMCFLTRMQGKFEGGGERITIVKSTEDSPTFDWLLGGNSQQEGVTASAVCFRPSPP